jgi:hypothetical protein
MNPKITSKNKKSFTIQVTVNYKDNMLMAEEHLQECLNQMGCLSTIELLNNYDTDGSPINVENRPLTSKGKQEKEYQSPYGGIKIQRHVYQSSQGGTTYIPLEIGSKIIGTATPKFAKMVSSKYSCDAAPGVQRDLKENHGRSVALSYIKNLTDRVGLIALAKEESWNYQLPKMPNTVACIAVGLDGTCLNMMETGWREAMCGTLAFFDSEGERMHTIYTSAAPEYGKETFLKKLTHEINKVKQLYPEVPLIGLADGASSNWTFLEQHCDLFILDFWHASEYLAKAAHIIYSKPSQKEQQKQWLKAACHRLKHKMGGASRLLNELLEFKTSSSLSTSNQENINQIITYFTHQKKRMKYYEHIKQHFPIGSGVTEAACKTIVKNRMCKGSAKWKDGGASVVITLRSLHNTHFSWHLFWHKYSQYGYTFER